jgi:hypothetical protein
LFYPRRRHFSKDRRILKKDTQSRTPAARMARSAYLAGGLYVPVHADDDQC